MRRAGGPGGQDDLGRATEKLTVTTDSGGLHFDLHSKVVQTAEEALGNAVLVAVRQVPAAEVVAEEALGNAVLVLPSSVSSRSMK